MNMKMCGPSSAVCSESPSTEASRPRYVCYRIALDNTPRIVRRAFSVAELLVVISIIVLALALAVPALNLIQGTKSVEQAQNLAGLMLAQARNDAIGLQRYRGVFFYRDLVSGRVQMCMVQESNADNPVDGVDVYLDLVETADTLSMPIGVSLQTVDDAGGTGSAANDRYLGYNRLYFDGVTQVTLVNSKLAIDYGGVILFDGHGQLANKVYALQTHRTDNSANPSVQVYTAMGVLMYATEPLAHLIREGAQVQSDKDDDVIPIDTRSTAPANVAARVVKSQVGFVLFDEEAFKNNGGTNDDLQIRDPAALFADPEFSEEQWLDNNSVPILVNRYNGSLVKGE